MFRTTTTRKKITGNDSKRRIIVGKEENVPFKNVVSNKRVHSDGVKSKVSDGHIKRNSRKL